MKRLILPLKKKWFDMIKSDEKKEEYREINFYWINRLISKIYGGRYNESILFNGLTPIHQKNKLLVYKEFDEIEFTLGYPRKDDLNRRLVFKNPKICVATGLSDWGAEKDKLYFVITWD